VPTDEDTQLLPLSPYAASKAAAELACERAARADGLDVVVARAFPHVGPGQDERFAVASWAAQISRLEAQGGGTLAVGDLSVQRDLTDVRDVARAYRLLLEPSVAAGTYNVASGRAVRLAEVVETLVGLAECPVQVEVDEARLRPADIPILCGDPTRLREATGWSPTIPLEQTLADTLLAARASFGAEESAKT
jgi:GDP-4-dehydro-6-deoxy-D-mannose reductase